MAVATLTAIREKVRKLTQSPSVTQLPIADLDEYINTFIAYDFPESLRLFTLRTTFTFYTTPFVDVYETNNIINSPLDNFKNEYITIEPPIYIAGYNSMYFQSREELFNVFPQNINITQVGTGDGASTVFSGTLPSVPVQRNNVLFSSIDSSNNGITLVDVPFNSSSGNLVQPNSPAPGILDPTNNINYVTGAFTLTFGSAPASATAVNAQVYPFVASRPTSMLYYNNQFTMRPIPDQPYKVTMDAFIRPTQLLTVSDTPELEQWWQYIAYGAAKKVLEDRMDMDTVQMIMPEFNRQERMVLRRTIKQQTNQQAPTIYNGMSNIGSGWDFGPQ